MSNIPKTCKAWILKEKPGEQVTDKVRALSHPHLPRILPCPRRPRTSLAGHSEPAAAS